MASESSDSVTMQGSAATPSPRHPVTPSPRHPIIPSQACGLRAWCYLVWLCFVRLARFRQMVAIALGLLALTATIVGLTRLAGHSGMEKWHWHWQPPPHQPHQPVLRMTFEETARGMMLLSRAIPAPLPAAALQDAVAGASEAALKESRFYLFSSWMVFSLFIGFLLPILSLSFATEALGGEREGRTLVWLLTRPLPRSSIYLAKFLALLPWSLGLTMGGFALLCIVAGSPGSLALRLYWPAVLGGTVAYCALFHLMGACFRRAAVVALVYSFFLETILGTMPGYMKRISLSFYTRCLVYDAAGPYGLRPEKPSIYLPVDRGAAWSVLVGVMAVLLVLGMAVFARSEYQDLT
jgi:ABC-2 type transport system permease protein